MKENEKPAKVEIEIVKFKRLLQALENPRLLWKLILSFCAMVVILFFGLSMVAVLIKSMFPYETIKTNTYGATIMEDEEKELVYWLFNSSELWAKSGIKVRKGDVLTIRSSGRMHTAVHHLVNDANSNSVLSEEWVDTDGDMSNADGPNKERAQYRLVKHIPQNKLLMQVVEEGESTGERYVIGKERTEIVITEDGYLEFAVNDIEMTDKVIAGLYQDFMDAIIAKHTLSNDAVNEWKEFAKAFLPVIGNSSKGRDEVAEEITYEEELTHYAEMCAFINTKCPNLKDELNVGDSTYRYIGVGLGNYPTRLDSTRYETSNKYREYPIINEVLYYNLHNFSDAWFADNVGSFLIVIEITKRH